MRKGVFTARALAMAIAVIGVSIGPGGVATAPPPRARTVSDAVSSGGETVASLRLGDRGAVVWDDESDSGDGGDGDDGGDDDVGDD